MFSVFLWRYGSQAIYNQIKLESNLQIWFRINLEFHDNIPTPSFLIRNSPRFKAQQIWNQFLVCLKKFKSKKVCNLKEQKESIILQKVKFEKIYKKLLYCHKIGRIDNIFEDWSTLSYLSVRYSCLHQF